MATPASSMGQLQRSGTALAPGQKRLITSKKKRKSIDFYTGSVQEARDKAKQSSFQRKRLITSTEGGPGSGPHKGGKSLADHDRLYMKKYKNPDGSMDENRPSFRDYAKSQGYNFDRWKKKESVRESRQIRESFGPGIAFQEQGQDAVSKSPSGKKQKNRVYLVTIIEEGMGNSKDKNFYSGEALVKGAKLFNGAKSYADHPDAISEKTLPERSMKDLVGWYSNCQTDKNPKTGKARIRGKLHFFPAAKWLTDMIDTILTDPTATNAENQPLFGISINAIGKTRPAHSGNAMINYVEAFQRVDSADVVTEPAARGRFEKILESRGGVKSRMTARVTKAVNTRMREAVSVSPKKIKSLADSATAAYNSDNPDEMKQALYDIQKELYPLSSISGKGPGQSNEEQYSNVNPAGGSEMKTSKRPVRASTGGGRRLIRKKKRFTHEADGTGPDNEDLGEPSPDDIEQNLEEADVEDEEGDDLGEFDDFGDSSKAKKNKEAAGRGNGRRRVAARATREDEGTEGFEDEGMEDDMSHSSTPGGAGAGSMPSPSSAGPGSSRMVTAHDGDGDGDSASDDGDGMSDEGMDDDLGEAFEDEGAEGMEDESLEGMEDEGMEGMEGMESEERPRVTGREARNRRPARRGTREASLSGGLGKSGRKALPSPAGGSEDYTEDYTVGKRDTSTRGTGKSYKLKTSVGAVNRPVNPKIVRKLVHEANRRIGVLEGRVRLRESQLGAKERVINRYRGIIGFHNSRVEAKRLLESAVSKGLFGEDEDVALGLAHALEPKLYRLTREEKVQEIKVFARLRESAAFAGVEGVRMMEGVEGNGARGGAVSGRSAVDRNSELEENLMADGIPMREEE